MQGGQPFPNAAVFDIQRLASTGAWEIGVTAPGQRLTVMTWHAGPPAFGGAQARNRLRNAAENDFWRLRLDGALGPAPQTPFVLLGDANLDPARGDGDGAVISRLLAHPSLQDPAAPALSGGAQGATRSVIAAPSARVDDGNSTTCAPASSPSSTSASPSA